MAVGGRLGQWLPDEDLNASSGRFDDVCALDDLECCRHAGPFHAEHQREDFMRHKEGILVDAIVAHQQPARETFIDGVASIGECREGHRSEGEARFPARG